MSRKNKTARDVSVVRSSAAEYLTFVAATGNSETSVEMRYEDENIWLTQKMMATLNDVSVPAVSQHLKRIFDDNELQREATIKKYLIVQTEGSRQVRREVEHYNLPAIIAVGFKIENERAVQFRKWANQIIITRAGFNAHNASQTTILFFTCFNFAFLYEHQNRQRSGSYRDGMVAMANPRGFSS